MNVTKVWKFVQFSELLYVGSGFEKAAFFISSFFKAFVAFLIIVNPSEIRIFNDVVKYSSSWRTRKMQYYFHCPKEQKTAHSIS